MKYGWFQVHTKSETNVCQTLKVYVHNVEKNAEQRHDKHDRGIDFVVMVYDSQNSQVNQNYRHDPNDENRQHGPHHL
jgi:hypothetical protein